MADNYCKKDSPLRTKGYNFAVRIVRMVKHIGADVRFAPIFTQVLKSGTSISANIHEAEYAQSKNDFVSKMSIALKEANETSQWLSLLKDTDFISQKEFESINADCDELLAMLTASIKTIKKVEDNKQKQ